MATLELVEDLGMLFPKPSSNNKVRFGIYSCHCGSLFKARTPDINRGHTKSCGCLKDKLDSAGFIKTKLYYVFHAMLQRCQNSSNKDYKYYGARGIKVCDEWKQSFKVFRTWAKENGYSEGLTIDREDNDLGYSPDNCRWVSRAVQNESRRKPKHTYKTVIAVEKD